MGGEHGHRGHTDEQGQDQAIQGTLHPCIRKRVSGAAGAGVAAPLLAPRLQLAPLQASELPTPEVAEPARGGVSHCSGSAQAWLLERFLTDSCQWPRLLLCRWPNLRPDNVARCPQQEGTQALV